MSTPIKLISALEHFLIAAHGFVLILVIGQSSMAIPSFLQILGRMHPLLLHFPIVLMLLAAILIIFPKLFSPDQRKFALQLLLIGLVFTAITVIAGLFLSSEPGYSLEEIKIHQWTGLSVFWLGSILYLVESKGIAILNKVLSSAMVICLLVTGHLGASLTHGEDFLWSPLVGIQPAEVVPLEDALAYAHLIKPILEQKCVSCHKASKRKGELRLDNARFMMEGGENGPVLDMEKPEQSPLLLRIFLPLEDEEHMPPKGKVQLTEEEISMLQAWILDSAHFDKKIIDYNPESSFFMLASAKFDRQPAPEYEFPAVSPQVVRSLNNFYRRVIPISPQSPALRVSFFGKDSFSSVSLQELEKIKEQVVDLNLSNMPLVNDDLKFISSFRNLETLNLNFTGIGAGPFTPLSSLNKLKSLSLTGNQLSRVALADLQGLKQLENLYLWNTGLSSDQIDPLRIALPFTKIETGYQDDGTLHQLNPPKISFDRIIFNDQLQIKLQHPIGSVLLFYTLDNTLPDSNNHLRYEEPIVLKKHSTIRARAFAEGWLGSEEASAVFFKAGIKPDQFELTHGPDEKYLGNGAETLFDLKKGDLNFGSGLWLGFQDNPMEITMTFDQAQSVQQLAFSLLTDEVSHIFPPSRVEIWAKTKNADWQPVQQSNPEQPDKPLEKAMRLLEYPVGLDEIVGLKAILQPVKSLPKWHPAAGQKGWIFIDEILIN